MSDDCKVIVFIKKRCEFPVDGKKKILMPSSDPIELDADIARDLIAGDAAVIVTDKEAFDLLGTGDDLDDQALQQIVDEAVAEAVDAVKRQAVIDQDTAVADAVAHVKHRAGMDKDAAVAEALKAERKKKNK